MELYNKKMVLKSSFEYYCYFKSSFEYYGSPKPLSNSFVSPNPPSNISVSPNLSLNIPGNSHNLLATTRFTPRMDAQFYFWTFTISNFAPSAENFLFGHCGQARSVQLQSLGREFEYIRLKENESLSDYLTRLFKLINPMKSYAENLSHQREV